MRELFLRKKIGQFPVSRDLRGRLVACHVSVHVSWNVFDCGKSVQASILALLQRNTVPDIVYFVLHLYTVPHISR